jgi:hypothetical protein
VVRTVSREELRGKVDRGYGFVLVDVLRRKLAAMGYHNVRVYTGGKQDWIEAGLPHEVAHQEQEHG